MILWTCSTGDAGAADTRTLAAAEAIDAVLAHWGRQHPRTGGAEGVTVCVDDAEAYVGPDSDADGMYDPATTMTVMHEIRDELAAPSPDTTPDEQPKTRDQPGWNPTRLTASSACDRCSTTGRHGRRRQRRTP